MAPKESDMLKPDGPLSNGKEDQVDREIMNVNDLTNENQSESNGNDSLNADTKAKTKTTRPVDEMIKPKERYGYIEQLGINKNEFTPKQYRNIVQLLKKNESVFADKDFAPGKAVGVEHHIDTGNSKPINIARRSVKRPEQRKVIDGHIDKMMSSNVIRPSKSPWCSPIVLVGKKDGSIRFCVDYRKLNEVTIKDAYILPRIDDSLAALSGNKYFSGLDLNSGYWQIPMAEEDKAKTAFSTDRGL